MLVRYVCLDYLLHQIDNHELEFSHKFNLYNIYIVVYFSVGIQQGSTWFGTLPQSRLLPHYLFLPFVIFSLFYQRSNTIGMLTQFVRCCANSGFEKKRSYLSGIVLSFCKVHTLQAMVLHCKPKGVQLTPNQC